MSNDCKLSPSGGNSSSSETSLSPTDSKPSTLPLTVENVKKLEQEYSVTEQLPSTSTVEEYIERANLSILQNQSSVPETLWEEETPAELDTLNQSEISGEGEVVNEDLSLTPELLDEKKDAEGAQAHPEKSEKEPGPETSKKGTVPKTLSWAPQLFEKSRESETDTSSSQQHFLHQSLDGRKYQVEEIATQTDWSYPSFSEQATTSWAGEEKGRTSEELLNVCGPEDIDREESTLWDDDTDVINTFSRSEIWDSNLDLVSSGIFQVHVPTSEDQFIDDDELHSSCEFCQQTIKPFPSVHDLETAPLENLVCCRTYQEVFRGLVRDLMLAQQCGEIISIAPHPPLSQDLLKTETSVKLNYLIKENFKEYRTVFDQLLKFRGKTIISFKLSQGLASPTCLISPAASPHLPLPLPPAPTAEDLLEVEPSWEKQYFQKQRGTDTIRKYPSGKKFFIFFQDGSGQVYYPSGNLAVLVISGPRERFTYILLEDNVRGRVRAVLGPRGHVTCYRPNGTIWVNMSPSLGFYFREEDFKPKAWNWWDPGHHVHAPPFQPIYLKLNSNLEVRIYTQDRVFVTFTHRPHKLHFNAGTKLRLKDPKDLPLLKVRDWADPFLLGSSARRIRGLVERMQRVLKGLSCAELDGFLNPAPPVPLVEQFLRHGKLSTFR
ncbi:glutamate-rich protein 6B [Tachyglossus aculeatus]|uniref:glutamate-rich protein 6B n=1 Tax=Tachyglossus aculeatus TaxID=9261 RepID=UPI0018F588DC|nr:glutamate-rich protein 6B [Tachyglossus aculeatus]XP_038617431.1 glutamate-rich protein 6B [Tachyglossus aculeatus]XP_038617432.1 glutamate-rich protein 6B [Tachyglossus aculeatus]XP_038617433.1 glutamate-rich protein 6B [Tachyglossus aculeatus]